MSYLNNLLDEAYEERDKLEKDKDELQCAVLDFSEYVEDLRDVAKQLGYNEADKKAMFEAWDKLYNQAG